jgi:hypothetical protein
MQTVPNIVQKLATELARRHAAESQGVARNGNCKFKTRWKPEGNQILQRREPSGFELWSFFPFSRREETAYVQVETGIYAPPVIDSPVNSSVPPKTDHRPGVSSSFLAP